MKFSIRKKPFSNFIMSIVPSYCVNNYFNQLIVNRFPDLGKPNASNVIFNSLNVLKSRSATDYFRSHELLSYEYFVLSNNPFRQDCSKAELEYIPIVPYYWSLQDTINQYTDVNISSFISDIIQFMEHYSKLSEPTRQLFTVASPFNFRTLMGTGMPTQIRRGYAWDTVSKFVMSLSIGHYERYPQCPDLLRKSWNYVVEIPYISMNMNINTISNSFVKRKYSLFFAGRLVLFGPERVCSIRQNIPILSTIPLSLIVNITTNEYHGPINMKILKYMELSDFCLITKADSYSTSSLYHSIQVGCIPIVISDWFVFSYSWIIPYDEFIIRIFENDFLKNPNFTIEKVLKLYTNEMKINIRKKMKLWSNFLNYDAVYDINQLKYYDNVLMDSLFNISKYYNNDKYILPKYENNISNNKRILPFDMMLIELKLRTLMNKTNGALPCYSPYDCNIYSKSMDSLSNVISFKDIKDIRSRLCQHAPRLIGHYKIVYYMQCVRILWPLHPGKLKPGDESLLHQNDKDFIENFHNLSFIAKTGQFNYVVYPPIPSNIQSSVLSLRQLE